MTAAADRTAEARQVLRANDRGGHTVPTAKLYPYQWNWDSLFVALGWAEVDMERAWREIETLFAAQWPSGMVPHIVFWTRHTTYFPGPEVWHTEHMSPPTSGISQPPVAATVVRRLAEIDRAAEPALIDSIERWHRWWHSARDPEGHGIIATAHPWESGRDNSPDWDTPLSAVDTSGVGSYQRRDLELVDGSMRPHAAEYDRYLALVGFGASQQWNDAAIAAGNPFWVADPGITAILLRAERDLKWLQDASGSDSADTVRRIEQLESGFEQFWNPDVGNYCSIDLRTGAFAAAGTSASFLAMYAGIERHAEELVRELEAWAERCTYMVPSFDPRHAAFEPLRYWRGPVWCMMNYMIATGLADCGYTDWAERLRTSSHDLILRSGMAESFDPITGGAVGGSRFAWTAALWLAWASRDLVGEAT